MGNRALEPGLYIVPTPIGNLSDISLRAIEVLQAVDAIAAEDTRHSAPLMKHLDIATPMVSYHEHSTPEQTDALAARAAGGEAIALISDAGTPLVSDPGYRLVRAVQAKNGNVVALPGPCAAITALSASGLPSDRFLFEGFLPSKSGQRCARLEALSRESATLIFYEAPHRILDTLKDVVTVLGAEREVVLARELTKTFETIKRASAEDLLAFVASDSNQQRGEIVLLIEGYRAVDDELTPDIARLLIRLAAELPPRKAAAVVADLSGIKARKLYDYLLTAKGEE